MSTLGINSIKSALYSMIGFTIFCIIFAVIYNHFGHGVYSVYMNFMFLFPLILGVVIYSLILLLHISHYVTRFAFNSYNSGIVTLTLGSMLKGIFVIAGTNSPFIYFYWIVGILFILLAVIKLSIFKYQRIKIPK